MILIVLALLIPPQIHAIPVTPDTITAMQHGWRPNSKDQTP